MKFTILGQPITKKNSQMIIMAGKRPCIIQSKAYRVYEKMARQQFALARWEVSPEWPIETPIRVTCIYWLATSRRPDLTNLLAASHDVLEHCGVIVNDSLIHSVDGSRIAGVDKLNPRVEVEIVEFTG